MRSPVGCHCSAALYGGCNHLINHVAADAPACLKSLLGNTLGQRMATTTMTSKGQVTIPKSIRQQLGLRHGTRIAFAVEGDHAVLRPAVPQRSVPESGFGMVKVAGPAVPPDFDVAGLLRPKSRALKKAAKRGSQV